MDEDQFYDEFGNYKGPSLEEEIEEWSSQSKSDNFNSKQQESTKMKVEIYKPENDSQNIVLFEDKKYYEDAQLLYPQSDVRVQEEDTQPLEKPIFKPLKKKCYELIEKELPETTFNFKFFGHMMDTPTLIRNVAIVGHLHHGKTCFVDMLVKETHKKKI